MNSSVNETVARIFLEQENPEILNSATVIDQKAAKILAGYRGQLDLSGLKKVPYDVAVCLSEHLGDMLLNGIEYLTDGEEAAALASNQGDLYFLGLKYLSEDAADELELSEWTLHFDPSLVESLCSGAQYSLIRQIEKSTLKGIVAGNPAQLSEFARALIKERSAGLSFELPKLSDAVAKGHTSLECDLSITELKNLTDEVAAELSRHKGKLSLDDLSKISDSAAELLARHDGPLHLDGIKRLSKVAEKHLFRRKYLDSFDCLETLSPMMARSLAKQEDVWIDLSSVKTLSHDSAKMLSKSEATISLSGIKRISVATARAFATHRGTLEIDGLTNISKALAEALAAHKGDLSLGGIKELTAEVANGLANHRGTLHLSGLSEISDEAAKAIAEHRGYLVLDGLTTLSETAAHSMSKLKDRFSSTGIIMHDPKTAALLFKSDSMIEIDTKYSIGSYGVFPITINFQEGEYYYEGGDFSEGPFPSFDEALEALKMDLESTDGGLFDDEDDAEDYMNGEHNDW